MILYCVMVMLSEVCLLFYQHLHSVGNIQTRSQWDAFVAREELVEHALAQLIVYLHFYGLVADYADCTALTGEVTDVALVKGIVGIADAIGSLRGQ